MKDNKTLKMINLFALGWVLTILGFSACGTENPKTINATTFIFEGEGTAEDGTPIENFTMEVTFRGRQDLTLVEVGDGLNSYLTKLSFFVGDDEIYFDYDRRESSLNLGISGEATEVSSGQLVFQTDSNQQGLNCYFNDADFTVSLTGTYTITGTITVQETPLTNCTFPTGTYILNGTLVRSEEVTEPV